MAVLVAALASAGCGARSATAPSTTHVPTPPHGRPTVRSLLGCLHSVGADAADVSRRRDLAVSVGEVRASFSTFDVYIGIAGGRTEAVSAARALDGQLALLQQAGAATVVGRTVFYSDGISVPTAVGGLVRACARGDRTAAARALVAVAGELPALGLPQPARARFVARCRAVGSAAGCSCAYRRAARLFRYSQVEGVGWQWGKSRALPVFAGLLRTCATPFL